MRENEKNNKQNSGFCGTWKLELTRQKHCRSRQSNFCSRNKVYLFWFFMEKNVKEWKKIMINWMDENSNEICATNKVVTFSTTTNKKLHWRCTKKSSRSTEKSWPRTHQKVTRRKREKIQFCNEKIYVTFCGLNFENSLN
jgi:hypothetical protein